MKNYMSLFASFLENKKRTLLFNLIVIMLFNTVLTTILFILRESTEIRDWLVGFLLLTFVITPFVLILTFIFTMFWSLVGLLSKPNLSIQKVYLVILTCFTIYLMAQSINFLIFTVVTELIGAFPTFLFTLLTLLPLFIILPSLFSGFLNYVGFGKRFSTIAVWLLFLAVFIMNIIGYLGRNTLAT